MSNASKQGLQGWVIQRVSALYLLLFVIFSSLAIGSQESLSYAQWQAWIANPWVNIVTAIAVLMVLLHAWVGIRDVIMDYVHPLFIRVSALLILAFFLLSFAIWALKILWMVS